MFLHGAPIMGGLTTQGPLVCRKMITGLNRKQAQGASSSNCFLLLNKCRQQQSLQRTICQHVYAIKVYNCGNGSQKKVSFRDRKIACSHKTQTSHGGSWTIVLGLKSTKTQWLIPCECEREKLLNSTVQETLTYSRKRPLSQPVSRLIIKTELSLSGCP